MFLKKNLTNRAMNKNILIYDDDKEILFLCKTILQKYEYTVQTFSRCEDIVNDVSRIQPDLILMDLWIPEIGGEQAVALAKANEATKHVPILLFSANDDIKEIYKKVNADGYISKPFDVKSFIDIIQNSLASKS